MRILLFTLFCHLLISAPAYSAIVEGSLITQIRGITNQVTIRSSSDPSVELEPGANGRYRIDVDSPNQDFILITPKDVESNLYSPRIIPASRAGKDTLYIIPPTNPSLTIIVDNRTNNDFDFLIDKGIILSARVTSEKDYELTVIPHQASTPTLLIAGEAAGYPAVVKSVAINASQRRGILTIEPQDIGIQPPPVAQKPIETRAKPAVDTAPQTEPVFVEKEIPLSIKQEEEKKETAPPIQHIEKKPPEKKQEKPAPAASVETPSKKQKDAAKKLKAERIEAAQSAYYFSDRLVVKDRRNTSIAAFGGYFLYPGMDQSTQLLNYGIDLYNIKLLKKYIDLHASASSTDQLDGLYYKGSLTWHHSPYASIDAAYKSAQDNIWASQYDVSQTSIGINGYYKSQGIQYQLGVGVRFQVDIGDFEENFPEHLENQYRYLQSFYLIGSRRVGHSSVTVLAGMINEAFYASSTLFLFRTLGVNYTFKNLNTDDSYFTPFEKELTHKLSVFINFTLKNREKLLFR